MEESLGHPISYREKSKLLKEAANREAIAKIKQIERGKNYSKQVREMYMPRSRMLANQESAPNLNV